MPEFYNELIYGHAVGWAEAAPQALGLRPEGRPAEAQHPRHSRSFERHIGSAVDVGLPPAQGRGQPNLRWRASAMGGHILAMQRDIYNLYDRLDEHGRRVDRIERLLELSDTPV